MIPDAEKIAVAWAKADPALDLLLGKRVATTLPEDWTSPFLTVFQVDGDRDNEAPIGVALLQWDAWAVKGVKPKPDFIKASSVARTLIESASGFTSSISDAYVYGFSNLSGPRRRPDDNADLARFEVTCFMTIRELVGGA